MLIMNVRTADGAITNIPLTEEATQLQASDGARYSFSVNGGEALLEPDAKALRYGDDLQVSGVSGSGVITISDFFRACEETTCELQLGNETLTPQSEPINALRAGGFLLWAAPDSVVQPTPPPPLSSTEGSVSPLIYAGAGVGILAVSVAGASSGGSTAVSNSPTPPDPEPTPDPMPDPDPMPEPMPEPEPEPVPATIDISALIDDEPPVTGESTDGVTNDETPEISGSVSAALTESQVVMVERDGEEIGFATVDGTSWSITDDLSDDGNYAYQAFILDADSESVASSELFNVSLDTDNPDRPDLDNVAGNNRINANEFNRGLQITGEAEGGTTLTMRWGNLLETTDVDADGDWSFDIDVLPVGRGTSTLTVFSTDDAGNESATRNRSIRVDFNPVGFEQDATTTVGIQADTASVNLTDPLTALSVLPPLL